MGKEGLQVKEQKTLYGKTLAYSLEGRGGQFRAEIDLSYMPVTDKTNIYSEDISTSEIEAIHQGTRPAEFAEVIFPLAANPEMEQVSGDIFEFAQSCVKEAVRTLPKKGVKVLEVVVEKDSEWQKFLEKSGFERVEIPSELQGSAGSRQLMRKNLKGNVFSKIFGQSI